MYGGGRSGVKGAPALTFSALELSAAGKQCYGAIAQHQREDCILLHNEAVQRYR